MNRTALDRLSLVIVVIGALNWFLVGLFKYDLIASIFGGSTSFVSRTLYTIVGIAGFYTASLLFRESEAVKE